jgi:ribosome biogenesis GTPase A
VSDNPLVYLLDTPGILTPTVPDVETGLRLALCGKLLPFFGNTVTIFYDVICLT